MKFFLSVLLLGYCALLLFLFVFQRSLLFFPQPDPGVPAAHGLAAAQVIEVITADNLKLKSWYVPAQGNKPVLVHLHGNAGSLAGRAGLAGYLASLGYGQLIVGYRGYNGNPGSPSEQGLYEDARANIKWLEGKPFVLMGESLGTGIAVQMATEFAPKGIILESPYTSIPAVAQAHYWYVPALWLVRDRFDSLSKISRIHAPLLVVQSNDDQVVPNKFGRALFAAAPEPKQALWLDGVGHAPWMSEQTLPVVTDWLSRL